MREAYQDYKTARPKHDMDLAKKLGPVGQKHPLLAESKEKTNQRFEEWRQAELKRRGWDDLSKRP